MIELKIVNRSGNPSPSFSKPGDSGFDLRAWFDYETADFSIDGRPCGLLKAKSRMIVHTGIYADIPDGYEIQVRSRSGLSAKQGIFVLNSPGTVDSSYTGEICVILFNTTDSNVTIENGERIAQAVLCPVCGSSCVSIVETDSIEKVTERGDGGFGHTGLI